MVLVMVLALPAPTYSFTDRWTVAAAPGAVRDVITDLEHYPEWWPQVVAVAKLGPDDARVLCRSVLPYTLDLVLHAVTRDLPVLEVAIGGDLSGSARFRLTGTREGTVVDFAQEVEVGGLLRAASVIARPLLVWNHGRMMRGCAAGLRARLGEHAEHDQ